MPQLESFASSELSRLPSAILTAVAEAPMPSLNEGPADAPLAELLSAPFDPTSTLSRPQQQLAISGLWLLAGDLDRSHAISQEIHTSEGSFWHGIMHRREGDFGNAKYWFRKVGDHPLFAQLASSEKKVSDPFCAKHPKGRFPAKGVRHLFSAHSLAELTAGDYEDPYDFIDACSRVGRAGDESYERCQLAQWIEWQALMSHCVS